MFKTITIRGENVKVETENFVIRILNDENLKTFLANNTNSVTDELVNAAKEEYYNQFKKEFTVNNNSMAVEIWAHIYVERSCIALKKIFIFWPFNKLLNFLLKHCEVIDIGEKGHDSNRIVWDFFKIFRNIIKLFLPK